MKILVTGASGFVGSFLLSHLHEHTDFSAVGTSRDTLGPSDRQNIEIRHWDLEDASNSMPDLSGIDVIVHTAGKAHDLGAVDQARSRSYFTVNTDATLELARVADRSGVKRFVFLSSIKVNGDETPPDRPFTNSSIPNPKGAYAQSKFLAEQNLLELTARSNLEIVVIRPPLVYGPNVKGNLQQLKGFIQKGIPLPIGLIASNKRSLVSIRNLVSLIETCITHDKAPGRTFLVSDGSDQSTKSIAQKIGASVGRDPRFLYIPKGVIELLAKGIGRPHFARKLTDSLQVDITYTQETLAWQPFESVEEGMKRI